MKLKKLHWPVWISLGLLVVSAYWLTQTFLGPQLQVFVVSKDLLIVTKTSSGQLELPAPLQVFGKFKGKVVEINVIEGQVFKVGDPLVKLESMDDHAAIEKAKVEMKEYKSFVDGLEKDGLINKKENYSIKYNDGKLIINDKEPTADTYKKYRSFLDKHKKFNIEKDNDDFNINMD